MRGKTIDHELTFRASELVSALPGCTELARQVRVRWDGRLSSSAGHARAAQWTVLLNPRLRDFDGEIERTLRHELAHLVSYARAGIWRRGRLVPHGQEWRAACAELGIPDESRCHALPLPRRKVARRHSYQCPACATLFQRVRAIPRRRMVACGACCRQEAYGRFDARFQLVPV